ncbi:serine/threonine-protein kinase PLK1-like [Amblyomma americanum]
MAAGGEILTSTGTTSDEFPDVVIDKNSHTEYTRGRFLGKGGCAHCYQFVDKKANVAYAGKIVSKSHLKSEIDRQYLEEEINIHRTLCHKHVVRFHSRYEDAKNVYIILELCKRQSLEELHKCHETLTETEVRHLLRQLLLACEYLVQEQVADFGLATRVLYPEQLITSICGTTNYMDPEMLTLKGYRYEADIWAVGCIM